MKEEEDFTCSRSPLTRGRLHPCLQVKAPSVQAADSGEDILLKFLRRSGLLNSIDEVSCCPRQF